MQIFDKIGTTCKKVASKANDKSLALAVGTMTMVGASSANAAITVGEDGLMTGTIDTKYYFAAVGIVITFLAIGVAVGLGIRTLKKA